MKDEKLDKYVSDYIHGNKAVFDIIYEKTKKSVYLSIYAIIKEKQIIEDLMQDSYMKIIETIDKYEINTNFKAWVSRVARNIAINFYNRQKREILIDPIVIPTVFDDAPKEEKSPLLDATLNILKGSEKEVIIYKIVLGMTFKEISSITNLPMNTITYVYKKAIKKIKNNL